eukprot:gene15803-biopygen2189
MKCYGVSRSFTEWLERYGLSESEGGGGRMRNVYVPCQVVLPEGGACPRSPGTSRRGAAATSASRCRGETTVGACWACRARGWSF